MTTKAPTPIRPWLGYNRLPETQIPPLTGAIYTGMNGNPNYVTPPVPMPDFKAAHDDFVAKLEASVDGGKKAIAEKNKSKKTLLKMVKLQGHYVEATCKDDMAIFKSSGFEPVSAKTPITEL